MFHYSHFQKAVWILLGSFIVVPLLTGVVCRGDSAASPTTPPAKGTSQAKSDPPTLWSFAWASDMHMNASKVQYMAQAMRYIDTKLHPRFVLITGDNNYIQAPPDPHNQNESKDLRRQRYFKQFLKQHLKTPAVVLPGDNWPEEFEKVFGPRQFSFDCGGIHFLCLAPDRIYHGKNQEGLSVFDEVSRKWIRKDLHKNQDNPTIVAIHEPIYPMTFLDAPPLRKLLAKYPNVFAVLQGHVHVDLEYRKDGKCYLVAPALGEPPTPGCKLVNVTPTGLVVRTILHNKQTGKFETQPRRQIIEIPVALRSRIAKPKGAKFKKSNYSSAPARPVVSDPSLEQRKGELVKNAMMYFLDGKQ
ncbi:MAG: metallophosphoesterase [Phycisphaerae bacterium]|nr:metallophosphoesterase [Phycisphaerae bacterium]